MTKNCIIYVFLSCNLTIYSQNIFHLVLVLNSMSWNIGFLRNLILKIPYKMGDFFTLYLKKSPKKLH